MRNKPLVGVVGPCGSGKSTLIAGLERHGYSCRHIAQEHSFVRDMWQRISHPDILIFLDAAFEVCTRRRPLNWTEKDYLEQQQRLAHARQHAHLYLVTDNMTPEEVLQNVLNYLKEQEQRSYSNSKSENCAEVW